MLLSIKHVFQEMEELQRRGLSIESKVLKLTGAFLIMNKSLAYEIMFLEFYFQQNVSIFQQNLMSFFYRLVCADWIFMALLMGINAPSSYQFCLWCYCTKDEIKDFSSELINGK